MGGIIENPYETINRPDVEYKKSGTYNMVFTEKNTDYGLWQLDASNRIIIHKLIIDPNTEVGKDLIKRKLAYKGTDGVYYEDIEKQIFHLSSDILVILETTGHFRVSSKVK